MASPNNVVKRVRKDTLLRRLDPVCVVRLAEEFLVRTVEFLGPAEARCLLCGARIVSRNVARAVFHHLTQAHLQQVEELGREALALCGGPS